MAGISHVLHWNFSSWAVSWEKGPSHYVVWVSLNMRMQSHSKGSVIWLLSCLKLPLIWGNSKGSGETWADGSSESLLFAYVIITVFTWVSSLFVFCHWIIMVIRKSKYFKYCNRVYMAYHHAPVICNHGPGDNGDIVVLKCHALSSVLSPQFCGIAGCSIPCPKRPK